MQAYRQLGFELNDSPMHAAPGALLVDSELQLLPREVAYSRVNGVWNLSSEAGNLGTLYITNCRVVWFSNASNAFNVSIPHLQVTGHFRHLHCT